MNLQSTKQINIDVSQYKYISVNAKQYDRNLRYILITCYNQGELLPINRNTHFASIRYRKPDNYGVFNSCEITQDGRILVELTEQMLAVAGTCYADVVIHKNVELVTDIGTTIVNVDDKDLEVLKLEDLHNNEIISTMTFIVYVHESAIDNLEIESSYEYNKLNDLIAKAENNYEIVMNSCNDSKVAAKASEEAAEASKNAAATSETNADKSAKAAKTSETNADKSAKAAKASEEATEASKNAAATSETNASDYADKAESYAVGGTGTRENEDFDNAKYYKEQANEHAIMAQSYTVGGTGKRDKEDTSNSLYIYEQIKRLNDSVTTGLMPCGTITFEELMTVYEEIKSLSAEEQQKKIGVVYNISNDFTTNDAFREGAGNTYEAGTFVYYTANGEWDCLVGITISIATATEAEEFLGLEPIDEEGEESTE